MKTLKKVEITPVYVELIPSPLEPNTLYISEKYKTVIHSCLCGCGKLAVTPLHPETGWELIKHDDGTVSLTPSIGNYHLDCKSHYIITRNVANFV